MEHQYNCQKTHIFDGLHSASLISLGQLFENDGITILDKNEKISLKIGNLY